MAMLIYKMLIAARSAASERSKRERGLTNLIGVLFKTLNVGKNTRRLHPKPPQQRNVWENRMIRPTNEHLVGSARVLFSPTTVGTCGTEYWTTSAQHQHPFLCGLPTRHSSARGSATFEKLPPSAGASFQKSKRKFGPEMR
jgi:hypothetical protein